MVVNDTKSDAMPGAASYKPMLVHLESILQARQEENEAREAAALLAEKQRRDKLPRLPSLPLNSARSSNGSDPVAPVLSLPQVLTKQSGGPDFSHWEHIRRRRIDSVKAEMLAKLSDERDQEDHGQRHRPLSDRNLPPPRVQAVSMHRKAVAFDGEVHGRSARMRGSLDAATPGTRYLLAHRAAPERARMARGMQFRPAEQLVRALITLRDDELARQLAMPPATERSDVMLLARQEEERQQSVDSANKALALATLPFIKTEQAKLEASDFSLLEDYGYTMPQGLRAKCVWAKAKAIIFLQSTQMIVEPELQAHLALFNLQRNAACDVIASGKVLAEVKSEAQRAVLPGWQLGNTDFYEREALELRRELFYSTLVQAALENWWDVISDSFRSAAVYKQHLHMKEYTLLNKLIHKALVPDPSEAEMELCSKMDWERTVPQEHGVRVLSVGAWNAALFWLADLWTDGISAHEYATFLMKLLDGVTCLKNRFVHPELESAHGDMEEDKGHDEEKNTASANNNNNEDGNEDGNDKHSNNDSPFDVDALQAELESEKVQAALEPSLQEPAREEPAPDPPVPQESEVVPITKEAKARRNSVAAPKPKRRASVARRSGQSHRLDDVHGAPSPETDFLHPMKSLALPNSKLQRSARATARTAKPDASGDNPSDPPPQAKGRNWRVSVGGVKAGKPVRRPQVVSPLDSLLEPATTIMDGWEEAADEAQREQTARADLLEMHPSRGSEEPPKSQSEDPLGTHPGRGSEDPTPPPVEHPLETQQIPQKRHSAKSLSAGASSKPKTLTVSVEEEAGEEMHSDFRGKPYKDRRHWANTERRLLPLNEVRCIAWSLAKSSHATSKRARRKSDFHLVSEELGPARVRKAKQEAHRRTLKRLKLFRRYILDGVDENERKGDVKVLTDIPQFLVPKKPEEDKQPSEAEEVDSTIELEVESEHETENSEKGDNIAEVEVVRVSSVSSRPRTPVISTYPQEAIMLPSVAARVARQSQAVEEYRRMSQPGFMAQDEDSDDERPFFKVDTPDASPECTDDSVVFKIPGSDGGSPPTDEHQESGIGPVSRNTFGKHASSPQANGLHIKPFHAGTPTKQRANLSALSLTRTHDALLGLHSEESPTLGDIKLETEEPPQKDTAMFDKKDVWLQADKHLLLTHVRPNRMSMKVPRTWEPATRRPRISAGPRMGDPTDPEGLSPQEKSSLSMSFTGGNLTGMGSVSLPRMSTHSLRQHLLGGTALRMGNLEETADEEGSLVGRATKELRCEGSVPGADADVFPKESAQTDKKVMKKVRTRKKIVFEDGEHMIKVQEFPSVRLRPTQRWSKVQADEAAQNSPLSKLRHIRRSMPSQAHASGRKSTTGFKALPSARSFYTSSQIAQSDTMEEDTSLLNALVAQSRVRKQRQASPLRPP